MSWTQIADKFFVHGQINTTDIEEAKAAGINIIVCNRPDGEEANQPSHAEIQALAEAAGIEYVYLPMKDLNVLPEHIEGLKTVLAKDKKVLAYCRSGRRSTTLFEAAQNN
jgi:uncharacterized protein (TIGR01244 family)